MTAAQRETSLELVKERSNAGGSWSAKSKALNSLPSPQDRQHLRRGCTANGPSKEKKTPSTKRSLSVSSSDEDSSDSECKSEEESIGTLSHVCCHSGCHRVFESKAQLASHKGFHTRQDRAKLATKNKTQKTRQKKTVKIPLKQQQQQCNLQDFGALRVRQQVGLANKQKQAENEKKQVEILKQLANRERHLEIVQAELEFKGQQLKMAQEMTTTQMDQHNKATEFWVSNLMKLATSHSSHQWASERERAER